MSNTTYSKEVFTKRQPDTVTATKLNQLRDDLSTAIAASGGGGGSFNPGTWTTLSLSSGWVAKITPQFRVESSGGTTPIVFARGAITMAAGAAATAFTFPSGARPPATRMVMVAGLEVEGQVLFHAQVATSGDVTITPVVRAVFTWPTTSSPTDVYLDALSFSL